MSPLPIIDRKDAPLCVAPADPIAGVQRLREFRARRLVRELWGPTGYGTASPETVIANAYALPTFATLEEARE